MQCWRQSRPRFDSGYEKTNWKSRSTLVVLLFQLFILKLTLKKSRCEAALLFIALYLVLSICYKVQIDFLYGSLRFSAKTNYE